ncbi:MAG: hypothetical protein LBR09_03005 [Endomicrobium sp.]|nr:hypothetical protein [Endomicrobium sp.]
MKRAGGAFIQFCLRFLRSNKEIFTKLLSEDVVGIVGLKSSRKVIATITCATVFSIQNFC